MNQLLYQVAKGELSFVDDRAIAANPEFAKQLQSRLQNFWLLKDPDGQWGEKSADALQRFKTLRAIEEKGCGELTAAELVNTDPKNLLRGYRLSGNDASLLTLYYTLKNWRLATGQGELNLCSVRGINKNGSLNGDEPFVFNDRIKVFRFKKLDGVFIPEIAGSWLGTADPGRYYWDNPLNTEGCAYLIEGQQFKAWGMGIHRNYQALTQQSEIIVWRGRCRNPDKGDGFGVNIHSVAPGQDYSSGDEIGRWSAGCTVFANRQEFDSEFMPTMKSDPRYKANNGYLWWYVAFSGKQFREWFPVWI